jgi:spore maturation protein CgeB/glycosyltransferase involved in cell wall biosynthesis/ubiquinone/menaquinone biosynthesis C-methylase UbiE
MRSRNVTRDRIAQLYFGEIFSLRDQEIARERINWIVSMTTGRVLDIGCSEGILELLVAREGREIVGIDINHNALDYARNLINEESDSIKDRIKFIEANAYTLELPKNSFDTLILSEILEHTANPREFLSHCLDFIKDNGKIVITVPFSYHPFPDHKHTFTLSCFLAALESSVTIDYINIVDKYIRCLAYKGKRKRKIEYKSLLRVSESAYLDLHKAFLDTEAKRNEDLKSLRKRLDDANLKYRAANERINTLQIELGDSQARYRITSERLKQLEQRLERKTIKQAEEMVLITEKLNQVNQKYGILTREQIPALKGQVNDERRKRRGAEERIEELRSSPTFRVGYSFAEASKSVRGVFALPIRLFRILREVKNRESKENRLKTSTQRRDQAIRKRHDMPLHVKPYHRAPRPRIPVDQVKSVTRTKSKSYVQTRVACIMDEFTFRAYNPECELLQITPERWQEELNRFEPDFLFIESAWRGRDNLWAGKIGYKSVELQGIVAWCREHGTPTVFWNKEDPIHYETFLNTAQLFDYVFTTDIDCIQRYKADLGHDKVFLLPFACQPTMHNPIETYDRIDSFCFAGGYYTRYPERIKDLDTIVKELPKIRPIVIYDRSYGKSDPRYKFPEKYNSYIAGKLPFEEIDKAYKGYKYSINLNSIKQSQTMFARRVFELLACNTLTISNYSRGLSLMLGDLVVATDSGPEMCRRIADIIADESYFARLRLAALRKVMSEHTYGERFAYVLSKVTGRNSNASLPKIAVIAKADCPKEANALLNQFRRQSYLNSSFILVADYEAKETIQDSDSRISFIINDFDRETTLSQLAGDADYVTSMVPTDYYGRNYCYDLALASIYSKAIVFGKASYYSYSDSRISLRQPDSTYMPTDSLQARCSAIHADAASEIIARNWIDNLKDWVYRFPNQLSIDQFNYCRDGAMHADASLVSTSVEDLDVLNIGVSISELNSRAESAKAIGKVSSDYPVLSAANLAEIFGNGKDKSVQLELDENGYKVESNLADGKHRYIYAKEVFSRYEYPFGDVEAEKLPLHLETTPGVNLKLALMYLDLHHQRISHSVIDANRNEIVEVPIEMRFIQLGLRVCASGTSHIKRLLIGHRNLEPCEMIGKSSCLVLTNNYPSYEDLYRNAFVHTRIDGYLKQGVSVDVFRLMNGVCVSYHEFQGVDIITGSQAALRRILSSGKYRSVLVHFLNPSMFEILSDFIEQLSIIVWIHGAEIQPWYRRQFDIHSDLDKQIAIEESEARLQFWRNILDTPPTNLKLVFVSRYFAEEVMEDLRIQIPERHIAIIHNPINVNLFEYEEKSPEQRKRILSIRPFASYKYANDLTVDAVLELSRKPFFNQLEFRIIGDGKLFDDTLAPIRNFKNVQIERQFLTHNEIAKLHKDYGVFLCPTRMDSQGVSRDEAMSSGLVPVTNAVAAVPEFVDETCGILASPENAAELAAGIEALYRDPNLFIKLSKNASLRVRSLSARNMIIAKELSLLAGEKCKQLV